IHQDVPDCTAAAIPIRCRYFRPDSHFLAPVGTFSALSPSLHSGYPRALHPRPPGSRMHRHWIAVMATAVALLPAPVAAQQPPAARIIPRVDTLHGDVRVDNYFWLREKTNPEVISYLEAENRWTEEHTAHTAALRERLYQEMLGRIKETDAAVPVRDNGWWYYTRTEQGKAYPIFCRRRGTTDAPEEIYFDQNQAAAGKPFHALGGMDVSPDGRWLLVLEDTTAFREYTLYVKDLGSGAVVDEIPGVWNGTAWADDNRTFFYMTADSAKRGNTVSRHVVGTPRESDG